jgi:vacuolar-type H+-ATPase subunit I/STV1
MSYLDTRDLEDRRQELEDELETLKSAVTEAEEALAEADEDDRDDAEIELDQARRDLDEWVADNQDELDALNNLRDEFDRRSWRDGIVLIPDDDFEDYARDLAEDLYGNDIRKSSWPFDCIDWEQAADSLRMDYSSVDYEGVTYLYRE